MKTKILLILFIISALPVFAQVGIGTNNPDANAALDIVSSDKGVLLPRVNLSATKNASPLSAHVKGMLVYNDTTAGVAPDNVTPGYYYNNGTKWIRLITGNDADHTDDAFLNDSINTQVKLATQSDGKTARTPASEFVITDNGKVGVGTNTPATKLDINGEVKIGKVNRVSESDSFLVLKNGVISTISHAQLIESIQPKRLTVGILDDDMASYKDGLYAKLAPFGNRPAVRHMVFDIKFFNSAAGINKQNMDILFLAQFPDSLVYSGMMDSIDNFIAAGGYVFSNNDDTTLDAVADHFGFPVTYDPVSSYTPTSYGISTLFSGSWKNITDSIETQNTGGSHFSTAVGSGLGKNAEIIAVNGTTNRIIKVLDKNVFLCGDFSIFTKNVYVSPPDPQTDNEYFITNTFEYIGNLILGP